MANARTVELGPELAAGLASVENGSSDEGEEGHATEEAAVSARPRARARSVAAVSAAPLYVSPLGGSPPSATHWGVLKRNSIGEWERKSWAPVGSPVEVREWPLGELSFDALFDRWGPGEFQIQWIEAQPRGGIRNLRGGREVTVRPRETAAAPAAAASVKGILEGPVGDAMALMKVVEGLANNSMGNVLQIAGALRELGGGGGARGISGEELRSIMRDEREAQAALLAASEARTKAEIAAALAAVRAAEDDDEDDDEEHPMAAAAGALGPLIKGKGRWASIARFITANPGLAEKALPIVHDLGGQLLGVVKQFSAPAPPPRPVAAPRVVPVAPVVVETPVAAPPMVANDAGPSLVVASSLSSWPAGNG